jgi:sigma-54 dependent transcriptional regulator, acetoin dehydrogenase operon transcriptional activator AcoR
VDVAGNVVLANTEAAVLLGTPADTPAYAPADRWTPRLPALAQLVGQAMGCASRDPCWNGATQLYVPFLGAPVPVAVRPVPLGTEVIGALLAFGSPDSADGDPDSEGPSSAATLGSTAPRLAARRVVAYRQDRWVLLEPAEIRFAEVDHNNVWLMSDQGRLLAATRGLDRLEQELEDQGFLRVHRRFLVNPNRIREIEPGFKGSLFLHTDTRTHESIPVSRRHLADVRRALGLQGHG